MGERFRMRMADRIQGVPSVDGPTPFSKQCQRTAVIAPRFIVDAVGDLLIGRPLAPESDFPWCRPPYSECWLERQYPDGNSDGAWCIGVLEGDPGSIGKAVRAMTLMDGRGGGWEQLKQTALKAGRERGVTEDPASWTLLMLHNWFRFAWGFAGVVAVANDTHGRWVGAAIQLPPVRYYASAQNASAYENLRSSTTAFWYAISLMNCRGVSQVRTPPPPRHIQKNIVKKTGKPLLTYKTLCIDAFRKKLSKTPTLEEINRTIRLHMRRGNIANYTAEKPHVSGYVGPMWRSACVVGKKKNGVVVKDYRVTTG